MSLDQTTLAIVTFVNALAMAAVVSEAATWGSTKGGRYWVAGAWMQVLAWGSLIAGFAFGLQPLVTLGLVAMSLSLSLAFTAILHFNGRTTHLLWFWLPPLLAGLLHPAGVLSGNSALRIGGVAAVTAVQALSVVLLLMQPQQARGGWRWIMGVTMSLIALAAGARAWLAVADLDAGLNTQHPVNLLSHLLTTVAVNVNTLAFVLAQRNLANQELRRLASTDGLTGLLNRHTFTRIAGRQIELMRRYEQPLTLVMIDIDHFKRINDSFGHDEGDRVLKAFSEALRQVVRTPDIVGRYGGEEFCVLMPISPLAAAGAVDARLRAALALFDVLRQRDISFSVGASQWMAFDTLESLLKRADVALYEAKNSGRARLVLAPAQPTVNAPASAREVQRG